jgi:hypothetical protein
MLSSDRFNSSVSPRVREREDEGGVGGRESGREGGRERVLCAYIPGLLSLATTSSSFIAFVTHPSPLHHTQRERERQRERETERERDLATARTLLALANPDDDAVGIVRGLI